MDNIIENNKLIAKFMGLNKTKMFFNLKTGNYVKKETADCDIKVVDVYLKNNKPITNFYYHSDWNWLMEVVEKIESLPTMKDNGNFFFEIHQDSVTVFNSTRMDIIIEVIGQGSRINNTYQAVIEFIQWYNQETKSLL